MPIVPVLTGGVPSGCGIFNAPELVCGGSELCSGGGRAMMMLLLPPIGLTASAELAPRSTAAAAKIGNADFMRTSLYSRNAGQSRICAADLKFGCGGWPLRRRPWRKEKARDNVPGLPVHCK